jgi:hypothetical protein
VNYSYRAYGLTLCSDTPLHSLKQYPDHSGKFDVVLSLSSEPDWLWQMTRLPSRIDHPEPEALERGDPTFALTSFGADQFFELSYRDGARFVVDAAAERLWGTCPPPLTIEDVATYLLGPVMGFILRRRGVLALHASAVCIHGQAVLLCGESQTGKSTTAAALALKGVPVLCEDITPLCESPGGFQVKPGYPRVCLWPDAVQILLGSADALPQLTPTWEKYFLPLDGIRAKFEDRPSLLGAVYLMGPRTVGDNVPRIEQVSATASLLDLVQNTYMNTLLNRAQRAAEFDVLSRMVMKIPVRRIVPHTDPSQVGALCDLIVEDAQRQLAHQPAAASSFGP